MRGLGQYCSCAFFFTQLLQFFSDRIERVDEVDVSSQFKILQLSVSVGYTGYVNKTVGGRDQGHEQGVQTSQGYPHPPPISSSQLEIHYYFLFKILVSFNRFPDFSKRKKIQLTLFFSSLVRLRNFKLVYYSFKK